MGSRSQRLAQAALLAALYAVVTHLQNLLLPGSASWAIQFRISEALCVLAFFTPAAISGLTLGCLLFNLTLTAALPLDPLLGSLATFLAASGMYLTRRWKLRGFPLLGMLLPALCNGLLIGWELSLYLGGGFLINAAYIALGEAAVLLILGSALYHLIRLRRLDIRFFL